MLKNMLSVILIILGILLALSLFGLINISLAFVYTGIFIIAIVLLIVVINSKKMSKNNS